MAIHPDYLTKFPPMQRAKVEAALDRQMRLDGRYMFRWQAAELLAADKPYADWSKGRLYHGGDGCFYDVSALTKSAVEYALWLAGQPLPCDTYECADRLWCIQRHLCKKHAA